MEPVSDAIDLTGKLLIAMPGMGDPRFDKSVVFICAHSPEGAMGLIVNKPAGDLQFTDLLRQLSIDHAGLSGAPPIYIGGPVEHGRGFVLHSADYQSEQEATLNVLGGYGMTATLDVLEAIATGKGPESSLLALGYSGWGPGQIEIELQSNGWLVAEAQQDLVFSRDDDSKWHDALSVLGINALTLSPDAGRA